MLSDMIAEVQRAEAEADAKVTAARAEAEELLKKTKEKAERRKAESKKLAEEKTAAALEEQKRKEDELDKQSDIRTDMIAERLREGAAKKGEALSARLKEIMFS